MRREASTTGTPEPRASVKVPMSNLEVVALTRGATNALPPVPASGSRERPRVPTPFQRILRSVHGSLPVHCRLKGLHLPLARPYATPTIPFTSSCTRLEPTPRYTLSLASPLVHAGSLAILDMNAAFPEQFDAFADPTQEITRDAHDLILEPSGS